MMKLDRLVVERAVAVCLAARVDPWEAARVARSFTLELPYHGFEHCVGVAERCLDAARFCGLDADEAHDLVLAGLFHDAGHKGANDDAVNVASAVACWGRGGRVARLVGATQFPHVRPASDLLEGLVRDADVLEVVHHPHMADRLVAEVGQCDTSGASPQSHVCTDWGRAVAHGHHRIGTVPVPHLMKGPLS